MLVQDTLTGYLHEVPDSQLYEPEYAEYPEPVGEVVYDGFGNPVGLPFLAPIASALAPMAAKALPGVVKGLTGSLRRFLPGRRIQRALPGAIQRFAPFAQAFQRAVPGAVRQFAQPIQALQQAVPAAIQQFAPGAQAFQRAVPGVVQQFAPVAQAFQEPLPGAMDQPMPAPGGEADLAEVPYPMPMQPMAGPAFRPPGWIPRPSPYTGLRPRPVYMRCLVWRGPKGLVPALAAHTPPIAVTPPATAVTTVVQPARAGRFRRPSRIGGRRR
jgi:hypothetical protein